VNKIPTRPADRDLVTVCNGRAGAAAMGQYVAGQFPGPHFMVNAGGFVAHVADLAAVRAFVAETDAKHGTVRSVSVCKISKGIVVQTKTLRTDWVNL
jgi:hypothetical protein